MDADLSKHCEDNANYKDRQRIVESAEEGNT